MAQKEEKVEIIDFKSKKTVYATANNPYHKTGEEIEVHPHVADHLVEKGFAHEDQKAAKASKKTKKTAKAEEAETEITE